jgi:solute carrier family 25 citrate transporter 1
MAGATAGAVEGFLTYPFEFLKTQSQFANKTSDKVSCLHIQTRQFLAENLATLSMVIQPPGIVQIAKDTLRKHGVAGFYSGCGALVVGNALKAAVRFTSYDRFKTLMVNEEVHTTGHWTLILPV